MLDDPVLMYQFDRCTIVSNLAGQPAISVPFGSAANGLPLGVQVMAPLMAESTLIRVAAVLEGENNRQYIPPTINGPAADTHLQQGDQHARDSS